MPLTLTEIKGTWEEILERAEEVAGHRVRVTVLDGADVTFSHGPKDRRDKLLAWLDERQQTPLTEEEQRVLDEFEQLQEEHPFRLGHQGGSTPSED